MEIRASLPLLCLASWAAEAIFACHVIEIHKQIISASRFSTSSRDGRTLTMVQSKAGPEEGSGRDNTKWDTHLDDAQLLLQLGVVCTQTRHGRDIKFLEHLTCDLWFNIPEYPTASAAIERDHSMFLMTPRG